MGCTTRPPAPARTVPSRVAPLTASVGRSSPTTALRRQVVADLYVAGITVTQRPLVREDYLNSLGAGNFDLAYIETWGPPYDPSSTMYDWTSKGAGGEQQRPATDRSPRGSGGGRRGGKAAAAVAHRACMHSRLAGAPAARWRAGQRMGGRQAAAAAAGEKHAQRGEVHPAASALSSSTAALLSAPCFASCHAWWLLRAASLVFPCRGLHRDRQHCSHRHGRAEQDRGGGDDWPRFPRHERPGAPVSLHVYPHGVPHAGGLLLHRAGTLHLLPTT